MTLQVVNPIDVTEAVLTASSIPDIDTSQGEVAWEPYDDKRVIIEPIPQPSTDRSFFGVYYVENIHETARYFFYKTIGVSRYFVGLDDSLSTVFQVELATDPSLIGTQDVTGLHVNHKNGEVVVFWKTLDQQYTYTYNKFEIPQTGTPIYNNVGVEMTEIDERLKSSQSLTNFTSSDFGYILWSGVNTAAQGEPENFEYTLSTINANGSNIKSKPSSRFVTGLYGDSSNIYTLDSTVEDKIKLTKFNKDIELVSSNEIDEYQNGGSAFLGGGDGVLNVGLFTGTLVDNNPIFEVVSKTTLDGINLYKNGDQVVYLPNKTIYQSLIDSNKSNPSETATSDATAEWIEVSPSNKWRAFDGLVNTKTKANTEINMTLNPVLFNNAIGFIGFSGISSIRIEVLDSGSAVLYDKTFTTGDFSAIYDYYTYLFYQIVSLEKLVVTDLPQQPNVTINVTISGSSIEIGQMVTGATMSIGELVADNTKSDRFAYREQQYNEFGYPTGAEPIIVELNTYDALVSKSVNPAIQKLLNKLTNKNSLWIGDIGGGQELITYGYFERSPIPFTMPNDINYQITVRASV